MDEEQIERCPCGKVAILMPGEGPQYVVCDDLGCWRGPERSTQHEAIAAWNRVIRQVKRKGERR